MKQRIRALLIAVIGVTALVAGGSAGAVDALSIERLAICQDSWLEWKQSDPARLQRFVADFRSGFTRNGNEAFVVPKSSVSVAGFPVTQVFPESVGMGVGFSVMLNAGFDATRNAVERRLGKRLGQCESGENMRTCVLEIATQKTVTLLADENPRSTKTLVGCFYLYVK